MTVRPILFSAPMVRALLDGSKTQTRRLLKRQPAPHHWRSFKSYSLDAIMIDTSDGPAVRFMHAFCEPSAENTELEPAALLRYAPGDVLWVRETWADATPHGIRYAATDDIHDLRRKRSAIHMPRGASRLTLAVTGVKVERLQDISEADAMAEGAPRLVMDDDGKFYDTAGGAHRCGFAGLWNHINGTKPGADWDANPWVVALTFAVHPINVDAYLRRMEVAP